jgi:hypothetical protein
MLFKKIPLRIEVLCFIFVPDLKIKCNTATQQHTNQQTSVNNT